MRVLVSGFEPFLDEKVNPTQEIAHYLNSCAAHDRKGWENLDVRAVVLPVLFEKAFERLEDERKLFKPDVILSFGLAGGRETFDIEQVAINYRGGGQTVRGDNAGVSSEGKIEEFAPLSLSTSLPTEDLLKELSRAGIPAKMSFTAGTYVCNELFFKLQDRLRFTRVRSGFIHVPRMTDDVGPWPWARFEIAIQAILRAVAQA